MIKEENLDYGMMLEMILVSYWKGHPKTSIYFASYYNDDAKKRALLFSIIVYLLNYSIELFNDAEIEELEQFQRDIMSTNVSIKIIEFLYKNRDRILCK
jgi:hypothetical protein